MAYFSSKHLCFIAILCLIINQNSIAQKCATVPSDEQISYTRSFDLADTRDLKIAKGIVDIPLQLHIISDDDGKGGIDQKSLISHIHYSFCNFEISCIS